jgi:hypothetical protein
VSLPFIFKNKEGAVSGINIGQAVGKSDNLVEESKKLNKEAENMYTDASKEKKSTSELMDVYNNISKKADLIRSNEKIIGNYQLHFNKIREFISEGTIKYPKLNNFFKDISDLKSKVEKIESNALELSQTSAKKSEEIKVSEEKTLAEKMKVEEENRLSKENTLSEEIKIYDGKRKPKDMQSQNEIILKAKMEAERIAKIDSERNNIPSPSPSSGPSAYCETDPLISNSLADIIKKEDIIIDLLKRK